MAEAEDNVHESDSLDTIMQYKNKAESNFEEGNIEEAFNNYLICLRLYPEWREGLKDKFVLVLCAYGELLEQTEQLDKLFSCYEDALEFFCDSSEILCNLGAHLCRLGFPLKAYYYFLEALRQNENNLSASRNLQNAAGQVVIHWHFRMLNDSYRNESYRQAITKKIQQKFDTVLDIGTGTGLLSMYAAKNDAIEVYGCDYNADMISLANEIIRENDLDDKITLIQKLSNKIEIPTDIPNRVSLVVTETMDSGLLGEHLLKTLSHAWEHLLLPPFSPIDDFSAIQNDGNHAMVIPHSGSLHIAGIEYYRFAKKYYYPIVMEDDVSTDDCIDALQYISVDCRSKSVNFRNCSFTGCVLRACTADGGPYDTENLRKSKYKLLTDFHELFDINFNNPEDINAHLTGVKSCKTITLSSMVSGYLHAIAAWFKVKLDDNIMLSSSPFDTNKDNCCWDQAMFPLRKPVQVIPGCILTLEANWTDGKVIIDVLSCTYPSSNVKFDCLQLLKSDSSFMVSDNVIRLMNDCSLVQNLKNSAITYLCDYDVDNGKENLEDLCILDLFAIPIFGLNILCNRNLINVPIVKLFCIAESESTKKCIKSYATNNSINLDYIEFISQDTFDFLCSEGKPIFDIIVANLVDPLGELNDSAVIQTSLFGEILKSGGLVLPKEINVYCQLIESDYLTRISRIIDDDIARLNISPVLNRFKISHCLDLDLLSMDFKALSQSHNCQSISYEKLNEQIETRVTIPVIGAGILSGISYWFGIKFLSDGEYSTLTDHAYVSQAAFVVDEPEAPAAGAAANFENSRLENKVNNYYLTPGTEISVQFLYQRGLCRLMVEKVTPNEE